MACHRLGRAKKSRAYESPSYGEWSRRPSRSGSKPQSGTGPSRMAPSARSCWNPGDGTRKRGWQLEAVGFQRSAFSSEVAERSHVALAELTARLAEPMLGSSMNEGCELPILAESVAPFGESRAFVAAVRLKREVTENAPPVQPIHCVNNRLVVRGSGASTADGSRESWDSRDSVGSWGPADDRPCGLRPRIARPGGSRLRTRSRETSRNRSRGLSQFSRRR